MNLTELRRVADAADAALELVWLAPVDLRALLDVVDWVVAVKRAAEAEPMGTISCNSLIEGSGKVLVRLEAVVSGAERKALAMKALREMALDVDVAGPIADALAPCIVLTAEEAAKVDAALIATVRKVPDAETLDPWWADQVNEASALLSPDEAGDE